MIRAALGDKRYWEERIANRWNAISMAEAQLKTPPVVSQYEAQYVWNYALDHPRQTLTQYARGDAIALLYNPFSKLLEAWEMSNRAAAAIYQREGVLSCRDWVFALSNLEHYNWCFWLVGLALVFDIPEEQWNRLTSLIGGEGEDELLDRVIATRQKGRPIGSKLLHQKPYARLLQTINSAPDQQAGLLRDFVDHWYTELKRPANKAIWWYDYGNPEVNPLEKGSYFGRWCVEAVAVVKAFGIDDSLCLGHEHYPGDFLRPDGPSTHPQRHGISAWVKRLVGLQP